MSEEMKIAKVMDLKGLPCPMPILKVNKGIKEVEIGQVIEVWSTDPGSLSDFPSWARTRGHQILKTDQNGDVTRFYVQRIV